MEHKNIIYGCIVLLMISFIGLSLRAQQARDENINKDWWTVSFTQPESQSLDFIIDNHSNETQFTYEIKQDNAQTLTRTINIQKGTSKEVSVSSAHNIDQPSQHVATHISVWTPRNDTKELSR